MQNNEFDFEEYIRNEPPSAAAKQLPDAWHNPDGDYIEFVFELEEYYTRDVDDLVTVYIGRKSGKIVGSKLKGIYRRLKDSPFLAVKSGGAQPSTFDAAAVESHVIDDPVAQVRITHILMRSVDMKGWASVNMAPNADITKLNVSSADYRDYVYKELFVKANSSSADLVPVTTAQLSAA